MVFSGIVLKFPYWIYWQICRLFNRLDGVVFYLDSEHDYAVIEYMLPYIKGDYKICVRNRKVARALWNVSFIQADAWPCCPSVLIMTRHAFHRFPIQAITKIGMRHGPYHFKKMISSKKYNAFDLYLFTSEKEVSIAAKTGVKSGLAGGYPRLDAFRDPRVIDLMHKLQRQEGMKADKQTILFTATWDQSGVSAIDKWIDHLAEQKEKYNVVVSLHPIMSQHYVDKARSVDGIYIAESHQLPAYMLLADVMVSDTSSVIAEFCALNKPIITFRVNPGPRLSEEIQLMIKDISLQIDGMDELCPALQKYLLQPDLKQKRRTFWNEVIFDDVHAVQGKRAADCINNFIAEQQK